jgi:hypothetical protein
VVWRVSDPPPQLVNRGTRTPRKRMGRQNFFTQQLSCCGFERGGGCLK